MEFIWYLLIGLPLALLAGRAYVNWGRPKRKHIEKEYVYQQPMIRRWTDKRKSEARLEKSDWDVDFYEIDAKASALLFLDTDIDTTTYVPSNVLKFASQTDPVLFRKLMAHNQRVDIRNGVPLAIVRDYNDY